MTATAAPVTTFNSSTDGRVTGVLHVGSLTNRKFTDIDRGLLQLAADRAAAAVQSMTARADRAAAIALQRSLLPSALPAVAGAELAARFILGRDGVGGDWYDVFTLPSGEWFRLSDPTAVVRDDRPHLHRAEVHVRQF